MLLACRADSLTLAAERRACQTLLALRFAKKTKGWNSDDWVVQLDKPRFSAPQLKEN